METYKLSVTPNFLGERIDKFIISQDISMTRSTIQKLISENMITVNNKSIAKNYKLRGNEEVTINVPDPIVLDVIPENLPIDIVYQDSDLLVVNKNKGMVVHPAPGNYSGTLVNALLYHCKDQLSGINGVIRPGIVHRIDKNTSGLLIVAKNDMAHLSLAEQIKNHSFTREYEAVSTGKFKTLEGTVNAPIGRHPTDRKKMCVTDKNSRNAITHYTVIEQLKNFSHIKLKLETGRTHQIRVHMAFIGHPILGDDVYGKPYTGIEGQCLHAKKIGFIHPRTNKYLEFDSQLPNYFIKILFNLKQ